MKNVETGAVSEMTPSTTTTSGGEYELTLRVGIYEQMVYTLNFIMLNYVPNSVVYSGNYNLNTSSVDVYSQTLPTVLLVKQTVHVTV